MSSDDICQGYLEDCWFLSAVASVSRIPNRMAKVWFLSNYQIFIFDNRVTFLLNVKSYKSYFIYSEQSINKVNKLRYT